MSDAGSPGRRGVLRPGVTRALAVASVAAVVALAGGLWINARRDQVSTDDAYVRADKTVISPKVRGAVEAVLVADNQPVRAGQALVRIDPTEYDLRLTGAEGDLMAAQAAAAQARAGLARLDAEEKLAKSQVAAAQALAGPKGPADPALRQAFETARGQALIGAHSRAEVAAALAQAQAAEYRARTALAAAKAERAATLVTAPADGVVGDLQAAVGALVQPGVTLMTLVRPATLYVTANFKETQTGRMLAGEAAEVRVDALPGRVFKGRVASLAPGTGSEFALLPFEPGAGNFTKIVQRVPVRIALDPGQPGMERLRAGLSAVVTVRLKE
ncbi:MAG: HlyD family secretion protein [Proteobacteria bacterium]|nr:HlyD family secretion protein [Pseudomonadota bacterium]